MERGARLSSLLLFVGVFLFACGGLAAQSAPQTLAAPMPPIFTKSTWNLKFEWQTTSTLSQFLYVTCRPINHS